MMSLMTVTAEIGSGQLADLVKQVQAGDDVVLTLNNKPVAKIISAEKEIKSDGVSFRIRSIQGHKVLTPVISSAELAEDLFSRP